MHADGKSTLASVSKWNSVKGQLGKSKLYKPEKKCKQRRINYMYNKMKQICHELIRGTTKLTIPEKIITCTIKSNILSMKLIMCNIISNSQSVKITTNTLKLERHSITKVPTPTPKVFSSITFDKILKRNFG